MSVNFGRFLGRCPNPKCRKVHTAANPHGLNGAMWVACSCHPRQQVKLESVAGVVSSKKCGARCLNAVGPSCDCSCGGDNHGAGH